MLSFEKEATPGKETVKQWNQGKCGTGAFSRDTLSALPDICEGTEYNQLQDYMYLFEGTKLYKNTAGKSVIPNLNSVVFFLPFLAVG